VLRRLLLQIVGKEGRIEGKYLKPSPFVIVCGCIFSLSPLILFACTN
jgi:hypothetical protein